jgi:hypothetical protein
MTVIKSDPSSPDRNHTSYQLIEGKLFDVASEHALIRLSRIS